MTGSVDYKTLFNIRKVHLQQQHALKYLPGCQQIAAGNTLLDSSLVAYGRFRRLTQIMCCWKCRMYFAQTQQNGTHTTNTVTTALTIDVTTFSICMSEILFCKSENVVE